MKKYNFLLLTTAVVAILTFCLLPANDADAMEVDNEKERFIIIFEDEIDERLLKEYGAQIYHRYEFFPAAAVIVDKQWINLIKQEKNVVYVDEDKEFHIESQVVDYGIDLTKSYNAKKIGLTGKGIKVAVIDSGISTTHPDLKLAGGKSFINEGDSYHDESGHGTHVAGIIAAQDNDIGSVGVAPDVSLYALKALDGRTGLASDIIAAIEWAVDNDMDIINLSLSSDRNYFPMQIIIDIAYENGILVVSAAGNNGGPVQYPAKYHNAIAVGSVDQNKNLWKFSSRGIEVDLVAPGVEVYSTTVINGQDSYAIMTGTSMAAPHVSGIIALYKEAFPYLSNVELREILHHHAVDLGTKGKDELYGYGLVQAPASVFLDLSSSYPFTDYINFLYIRGIVNGYDRGVFKPNREVTRAEAAKMIGEMLGINGTQIETAFHDVSKQSFASGYIHELNKKGIIQGYTDHTFRPNNTVTRSEMAIIIAKAFDLSVQEPINYIDVSSQMASYEYIKKVQAAGIAEGYSDNTFRPYEPITRGQFSAFVARGLNDRFK